MFGSGLTSEQKKLAKELFSVSLSIHMGRDLRNHEQKVRPLTAQMTSEQVAAAFDQYWKKSEGAYRDFYADGIQAGDIHEVMWHWLQTFEIVRGRTWPS